MQIKIQMQNVNLPDTPTLSALFGDEVKMHQELMDMLVLENATHTVCCWNTLGIRPIKSAIIEKQNDEYFLYFTKVIITPGQKTDWNNVCLSVQEIKDRMNVDLSHLSNEDNKAKDGHPFVIGALSSSHAYSVLKAMWIKNIASELHAVADNEVNLIP